jgi:microcystin-dependent protein
MSEPFLGQILMVSFSFAPKGYAMCNGQLLPISQNAALFSLLGTFYGGNGTTTFALPNLQGSTPRHVGTDPSGSVVVLGQRGGEATHTLSLGEMPGHTHQVQGDPAAATTPAASGHVWAANTASPYSTSSNTTMNPSAIGTVGGGQPHDNFQPYLVINFVIALQGIFPSRN